MFPTVDNLVALKIMMQVERDIGQALEGTVRLRRRVAE